MSRVADRWPTWLQTILAILVATAGGALAQATGMPAGWLIGAMFAVSFCVLMGAPLDIPGWLRDCAFVLVGLVMGASVSPDSLTLIGQWPITMLALAIELVLIVVITGWALQKLFRLDAGTGYMSSFPGHLSFVMAIASAGVGEPRQIAIIQMIRILLLTASAPLAMVLFPVMPSLAHQGEHQMTLITLALVAIGCTAVGFLFTRFKVPAGYVLGAMLVATTARLTGHFDGQLPPILAITAFILVGAQISVRLRGITPREIRGAAMGGLLATVVAVVLTTGVVWVVSFFIDMPFGQVWLALSPGGLESMGALGIAMGFDTAFIAAHHVARLLYLTFAIPLVVLLVKAAEKRRGASAPQSGPMISP